MEFRATHYRKRFLATLIAAMAHGSVFAEDAQMTDMVVEEDPLLDARLPNAMIVDEETLQSLGASTSDSARLLKGIPGLNLQGAGGVSSLPVIHGMADDRLRIKVDGMDLISACGNHMNPPLSYIDPTNVETATVFAGITPVSMGGDSIGSTIVVDSPAPEFAKPGEELLKKGEAGISYRTNGNALSSNVSATLASDQFSMTYRGSTTKADDYEAGGAFKSADYIDDVVIDEGESKLAADVVGSSMYKSTNQSLALGMRKENHLFELKLGLQEIPYQGWPNQRMDMTGNNSKQVNLAYEGRFDWGTMEARAYYERTRHKMQFFDDKLYSYPDGSPCLLGPSDPTFYTNNGCAYGMPMDTKGENRGLVAKGNIKLSERDLLRVGVETQKYRLDDWWDPSGRGMGPDVFVNINNGQRDRLAVFSEWEANWDPQWLTQLGMRYERVDMDAGEVDGYSTKYLGDEVIFNAADRKRSDDNIDLTAMARFTPDASRTVEFGYARKTRSPNLYERYSWSTGGMAMRMINMTGDGNGYVGNLELEPEIAHTLSATFDFHDPGQGQWGLAVTPYYTYVDDYIDARRCGAADTGMSGGSSCGDANLTASDAFVYLKFVNQSARLYGVDISGHMALADNTGYGDFRATGKLGYVRGKNRTTGDNLYNMMPLNATLAVEQRMGGWANTLELDLVDGKSDISQVRNEMETGGYGLLHLRSSYQWKQARFDFGIENIFDRLYSDPLGGAYLGEGKTMSGTDVPWGVTVPGMGRSFYAGVNVEF